MGKPIWALNLEKKREKIIVKSKKAVLSVVHTEIYQIIISLIVMNKTEESFQPSLYLQ